MVKPALKPCDATSPLGFTGRDIWHVVKRLFSEVGRDNVSIIAAGVAFFSMLAIFPLITACLSIYGYFADPTDAYAQLEIVSELLPVEAWSIISTQVQAVASAPTANLGLGIAIGLLIALWSAGSGIRAMMRAMNVAYGETEKRNLATFYALAGSMTLSVTIFLWVALAVIIGVPAALTLLNLEGLTATVTRFLPWIILISMFAFATMVLYRFGPSRRPAKMRWVLPGVLLATLSWLAFSYSFSRFVAEFGSYNKTYGGLSAVIILLIWFWLTAFVVIVGAELNAELERHTLVDTTRGPDRPIGERGAAMADFRPPIDLG